MKSDTSRALQGAAEKGEEVDDIRCAAFKAPNKDIDDAVTTIVKVVTEEDVTTPSEENLLSKVPVGDENHPEYPA